MGGDIRAVISARRAAAARAAMATAASGHHGNANQNDPSRRNRNRNRDDPLRMSQLERDLYNVATGKSSECIVAAKRRVSISSCVSAVSLPEELRDGYDGRFGEEFEDNGGWEDDYHQEKEEEGTYALDEDYEDYEIYDRNNEHEQDNWIPRTLKVGQIVPTSQIARGRQVIINGDVRTLHDQDIKSLRGSANKTNQEAIQTIIDLKMQLAHESSSKDELTMKLKQIANEKSEIERKLAEMLKEKEKLDALFNERNMLKKEVQLQQQQQGQANADVSEFKSGGRRNKRASWCAAMPNSSTSNSITTHFSSSMTKLTALVSELDNSISLRDLMDDKVTANAETSKNKTPHDRRGSGLDFSIKSFGTHRRSSSVFSGSLSALFSEAAVCPSENNGNEHDSDNQIDASDTKGDASVLKSLYSNNSSLSNTSRSIYSKVLPSTVTTAATSVTAATTNTPGISKALTAQDITSLMEENTKLLSDNANLSSENLQLKSDLEFLKKALENVLQNNDLTITSTGSLSMDSKVMDMLYNGNDVNGCVNNDVNTSCGMVTENSATANAPSNKQTRTLSSRTGFQRGRTIDSQSQVQSSTKPKLPHLLQDWSARDADAEIRLNDNLAGNLSTHSKDFIDQADGTSVDSEYSNGESSISIGDDTIRRELREVHRKFSSFSASVRNLTNPRSAVTRRSSLPTPTFVEVSFGSDNSADEEAQVGVILDDTDGLEDRQRRLRTKATRNFSLPPSASSSQQPSYLKSLSFRRYAPARSNSTKISGETGPEDVSISSRINDFNSKNSTDSPNRRNSMGLRKQSSLLLLQERLDSDEGMSVQSCDDDGSWVSNGNGVMVKLSM